MPLIFLISGVSVFYVVNKTLGLMPLFWWFKGETGSKVLRKLGEILAKPLALVLFLVPTIIIQNMTNEGNFIENAG